MGKMEKEGLAAVRKALTAMRELLAWQERLVGEALGQLGGTGEGDGGGSFTKTGAMRNRKRGGGTGRRLMVG